MLLLQEVLARLLQVYPALVGRQLCFKRLVFLHLTLQVGGVLSAKETLIKTSIKEQKSSNKRLINYFVSFICGRLHLLIDPALQLIRVPEELLQKGRIPQGSTAGLSALVQGITAAEQLQMATESQSFIIHPGCVFEEAAMLSSRGLRITYGISASSHILFSIVVVLYQFSSKFIQGLQL